MSLIPSERTHFYVFRHSETPRNHKGEEIQGWIDDADAQLNETGKLGAHQLGKGLVKLVPDAVVIVSSDLKRSLDTAEIVAGYYTTNLPILSSAGLREKCHGKWDTLSPKIRNEYCLQYYRKHEETLRNANDRFAKWKIEPLCLGEIEPKLPECQDQLETIHDVFRRGTEVFRKLGAEYQRRNVLISSHGAFNDIMATEAENRHKGNNMLLPVYFEPKARHFPKNCAVYHFIWDCTKQELDFVGEVQL